MNLESMSQEEREHYLEVSALFIDTGEYFKAFTPDEKIEEQEKFLKIATEIEDLEQELKRKQYFIKESIKPLSEDYKEHLLNLRMNGKKTVGNLYYIPDHLNEIMNIYTAEGKLHNSRPLKHEERLPNLFAKTNEEGTISIKGTIVDFGQGKGTIEDVGAILDSSNTTGESTVVPTLEELEPISEIEENNPDESNKKHNGTKGRRSANPPSTPEEI